MRFRSVVLPGLALATSLQLVAAVPAFAKDASCPTLAKLAEDSATRSPAQTKTWGKSLQKLSPKVPAKIRKDWDYVTKSLATSTIEKMAEDTKYMDGLGRIYTFYGTACA